MAKVLKEVDVKEAHKAAKDSDILSAYARSFTADGEYPLINTSNSPLRAYQGYLLDYDNPYGAGRITIN